MYTPLSYTKMKYLIILWCLTCVVDKFKPGRCNPEYELESLSDKEKLRIILKQYLVGTLGTDIEKMCRPVLAPDQIGYGNWKLNELMLCGNETIDKFINKLDDDTKLNDFKRPFHLRKYAAPVCEVYHDAFKCIKRFELVIDMCYTAEEKLFKDQVLYLVPLIQSTICLRNGEISADLLDHEDGSKCLEHVFEWMVATGAIEILYSNTTELFGSELLCREFNNFRLDTFLKVGECSTHVLDLVMELVGHFCDGTKCHRFIPDLNCYSPINHQTKN